MPSMDEGLFEERPRCRRTAAQGRVGRLMHKADAGLHD